MLTGFGTVGDDSLIGGDRVDKLLGRNGNDLLLGRADRDQLFWGLGSGSLRGGPGMDYLSGDAGIDELSGGKGNDLLIGGANNDGLIGGWGRDTLHGGPGVDRLLGENRDDLLTGGANNDELIGGWGRDTLHGGPGADIFFFFDLFTGIDSIPDFSQGDKIKVNTKGFLGATSASQFSYDNSTGALSFALSYSDEVEPIQFAALSPNLSSAFNPSKDIILGEDRRNSALDLTGSSESVAFSLDLASEEPSLEQGQMLPISATVLLGGEQIELEVAQTPQQRAVGLMHRDSLVPNRGMLFLFEMPRTTRFWMQNVVIPLDMVFLRDGEIKAIYKEVPPCTAAPCPTYGPQTPVDSVIELHSGRAAELDLKVGDRVDIQFLELLN